MKCSVCGFVYDPEKEGMSFDEQKDSYKLSDLRNGKERIR